MSFNTVYFKHNGDTVITKIKTDINFSDADDCINSAHEYLIGTLGADINPPILTVVNK